MKMSGWPNMPWIMGEARPNVELFALLAQRMGFEDACFQLLQTFEAGPPRIDGIRAGISKDRPAFLSGFLANFFNVDVLGGKRISDEVVRLSWQIADSGTDHAQPSL